MYKKGLNLPCAKNPIFYDFHDESAGLFFRTTKVSILPAPIIIAIQAYQAITIFAHPTDLYN
jgi:hypothetical protein